MLVYGSVGDDSGTSVTMTQSVGAETVVKAAFVLWEDTCLLHK